MRNHFFLTVITVVFPGAIDMSSPEASSSPEWEEVSPLTVTAYFLSLSTVNHSGNWLILAQSNGRLRFSLWRLVSKKSFPFQSFSAESETRMPPLNSVAPHSTSSLHGSAWVPRVFQRAYIMAVLAKLPSPCHSWMSPLSCWKEYMMFISLSIQLAASSDLSLL